MVAEIEGKQGYGKPDAVRAAGSFCRNIGIF